MADPQFVGAYQLSGFEEWDLTEAEWQEVVAVPALRERYGFDAFTDTDRAWFRGASRAVRRVPAQGRLLHPSVPEYLILGPAKAELVGFGLTRTEEGLLAGVELTEGQVGAHS